MHTNLLHYPFIRSGRRIIVDWLDHWWGHIHQWRYAKRNRIQHRSSAQWRKKSTDHYRFHDQYKMRFWFDLTNTTSGSLWQRIIWFTGVFVWIEWDWETLSYICFFQPELSRFWCDFQWSYFYPYWFILNHRILRQNFIGIWRRR